MSQIGWSSSGRRGEEEWVRVCVRKKPQMEKLGEDDMEGERNGHEATSETTEGISIQKRWNRWLTDNYALTWNGMGIRLSSLLQQPVSYISHLGFGARLCHYNSFFLLRLFVLSIFAFGLKPSHLTDILQQPGVVCCDLFCYAVFYIVVVSQVELIWCSIRCF